MYSDPPGADPATNLTETGHIVFKTGQGHPGGPECNEIAQGESLARI